MIKKISIIIPTFIRPERLNFTLKSLSQQTYPKVKFEVIIVNDGGDRKTEEVAEQFNDMNIKVIKGKGKGPATAKNQAIPLANGDIFLFLDDDVICRSDFLHKHAGYYNDHAASNTVVTAQRQHLYMQIPGEDTERLTHILEQSFHEIEALAHDDPHCKLLEKAYEGEFPKCNVAWVCLNGCNFSVSKEILFIVGGFNTNLTYLEDTDISLRLWNNGGRFCYSKHATNYHLEHAIDIRSRKQGWENNFPVFQKSHGLTAELYKMFFQGKITIEEFDNAYINQKIPTHIDQNWGSYWFWEEFALRRWKGKDTGHD